MRTQEHLRVQAQTVGHHPQHPQTQLFTAQEERLLDLLEPWDGTRWPFLQRRRMNTGCLRADIDGETHNISKDSFKLVSKSYNENVDWAGRLKSLEQ